MLAKNKKRSEERKKRAAEAIARYYNAHMAANAKRAPRVRWENGWMQIDDGQKTKVRLKELNAMSEELEERAARLEALAAEAKKKEARVKGSSNGKSPVSGDPDALADKFAARMTGEGMLELLDSLEAINMEGLSRFAKKEMGLDIRADYVRVQKVDGRLSKPYVRKIAAALIGLAERIKKEANG